MDLETFVEEYGASLLAGQASIMVGAGVSFGAGYPSWEKLLEPVAAELGVPPMTDFPLLAQYIENQTGGRERLNKHLSAAIGAVEPKPLESHVLLAQLRVPNVWSTNYDPLIETADRELAVVERDEDLVERSTQQRRFNKMHGSIPYGHDGPVGGRDQLVLSRSDYERYEATHPRMWRLLQAEFLTSSFLFLGFSMTDPNFDAVFKIARMSTADRLMPHYAVMKRAHGDNGLFDFRATDLRHAGIEVIEVEDFEEIPVLLRLLIARTRPPGLFVSGSARTPSDEAEDGADTYPTTTNREALDHFANRLGTRLAETDVPSIVAAGAVGSVVGYSYINELKEYRSDRFLLVRRRRDTEVEPPSRRQGQIHFVGDKPDILRTEAFQHVRAMVLLGGGPGSEEEARRALDQGMTVIPVAHTGGAAMNVWQEMTDNLAAHHAGQRPVDAQSFARLASTSRDDALSAAVEMTRLGLFLP